MATGYVEYGTIGLKGNGGSAIHGRCIAYAAVSFTGTPGSSSAVTALQRAQGVEIVRITVDAAAKVSVGSVPSTSAAAANDATTATRYLAADTSIELPIGVGEYVSLVTV